MFNLHGFLMTIMWYLLPLCLSMIALVITFKHKRQTQQRIWLLEQKLQQQANLLSKMSADPTQLPTTELPTTQSPTTQNSPAVPASVAIPRIEQYSQSAEIINSDQIEPEQQPTVNYNFPPIPPSARLQKPSALAAESNELEPDEHSVNVITSVWHSFLQWFKGGNAIVRVGILVLLVGVVLLLRLAVDKFTISIEARLGLVAFGGVALTLLGLKLREKRRSYAVSIQGAGLAIVYFTLFAAYRLYDVMPSSLTFGLLAVLAILSAGLALLQNALPMALLAFGGAFLAPILASSGSNNVVGLFSYYLMLNVALAWMANYRTWKVLNLLGAFMTFGLAGYWGFTAYNPSVRWTLEGLLLAHLALYLFIVVRYSQQLAHLNNAQSSAKSFSKITSVDSALLFGVPLMGFALQAGLLHDIPFALALSSAALSAIYLALGYYLIKHNPQLKLLTEGVLALGIGFMALVIPLALDAKWTSVGWSIQGAALVWVGVRQQRIWTVRFGVLLQFFSTFVLGWLAFDSGSLVLPLFIYAACLLLSAFLLRGEHVAVAQHSIPLQVIKTPAFWMLGWGTLASVVWLDRFQISLSSQGLWLPQQAYLQASLYLLIVGLLGVALAWRRNWLELFTIWRVIAVLLSLQALLLWWQYVVEGLAVGQLLIVVSVGYVMFGYFMLRKLAQLEINSRFDQLIWFAGVILHASLLSIFYSATYPNLELVILPLLLLFALLHLPKVFSFLQVNVLLKDLTPAIFILAGLWLLGVNWLDSGQILGLPYLPIVSALDILILALILLLFQLRHYLPIDIYAVFNVGIAVAAFWSVTGMVIRTLHQWLGTPLWPEGAWHSDVVQTSLTIVWTLFALLLTGLASRYVWRYVWIAGVALLALVVIKLLLVDLSNAATLARIVSFIGAGLIMLLIGYIAPLPPAAKLTPDRIKPEVIDKEQEPS